MRQWYNHMGGQIYTFILATRVARPTTELQLGARYMSVPSHLGNSTIGRRQGPPITVKIRSRRSLRWHSNWESTVRSLPSKACGYPISDVSDVLVREAVLVGTFARTAIVKAFGEGILQSDGCLDRKKLGRVIFKDEGKRKRLDKVVHPAAS